MNRATYRFKCASCESWHEGIPGWGWKYPFHYHSVPESEREKRCVLTSDLCVVDEKAFYVCGCLELPIPTSADIVSFRVWVSLTERDFLEFQDLIGVAKRSHNGPYLGLLDSTIPTYPDTYQLRCVVHMRDDGVRPYIEVEPTDHPLSLEQRRGVGQERIQGLYDFFEHIPTRRDA